MADLAIRARGVGKRYRLGLAEKRATSIGETLTRAFSAPWRALRPAPLTAESELWAVRDFDVDIAHGEVVGIVGRNGAGKSTLLKILSRITEPTEGEIRLRGRVASLLEVGTGFHPELTGRENIYLNGAILGMSRREIDRKFDEIVAFSEIERFLDTPVKRYSSGMYTRLAFAVAAHLEPEILIVDEVLAVGDAPFQKKCLGKMGSVAKDGRTVLFVSHNLGALVNLCPRAVLLVDGKKVADGSSPDVVARYIAMGAESQGERIWSDPTTAPGSEKVRLRAMRLLCGDAVTSDVDIQRDLCVEIEYSVHKPGSRITVGLHLIDAMGATVLATANLHSANLDRDEWFDREHEPGVYRSRCIIPGNFLNDGRYALHAVLLTDVSHLELLERDVLSFTVYDTGAMREEYTGGWIGSVRPRLAWNTQPVSEEAASRVAPGLQGI